MSRRAGKEPMVDDPRSKKRRHDEQSRRSSGGVSIGSPTRDNTPLAAVQRFINPRAMSLFNNEYITRKLIIEKEVVIAKVDSAFVELLKEKDWGKLMVIPKRLVNETMIREFYANLDATHLEEGFVMVRKTKVPFSPEVINAKYDLDPELSTVDHRFEITLLVRQGEDPLEELRLLIDPTTPWTFKLGKPTERKDLTTTHWSEDWRVKCKFIQNRLRPTDNITHFGIEDLGLLYAIEFGLDVNVGGVIYSGVFNHTSNPKRCIICPHLIHSICLDAKVPEYKADHRPKNLPGIQRDPSRLRTQAPTQGNTSQARSSTTPRPPMGQSERRQLSIAHSVRNWFKMLSCTQNDILANQRDFNSGTRITEESRFAPRPLEFFYDEEIEESIARMNLVTSEQEAAGAEQGVADEVAAMEEETVGEANNE